jgi:serine/threonine protein phosphatase 1
MTYVIGDIHGEVTKVKNLVENIYAIDNSAKLVFLGDYVNKGENSKAVLNYLITLKHCTFLMGNHEYYFLEFLKNGTYADKLKKYADSTTFVDFDMDLTTIKEKFYMPYKTFFDNLESYYTTKNYFVSHAGVTPSFAKNQLRDIPLKEFLFNRYDFFNYKEKIHGRVAIFGHTGFNYPYFDGYKIGIDTAAVYSVNSPLTSFCLEDEYFLNDKNEKLFLNELKLDRTPWINRRDPYRMEKK